MKFKGDSIVLVGTDGHRNAFGAWVSTYNYEGVPESMAALANNQPLGREVDTRQNGAVVGVGLTYAPDSFTDKWETDRENLDKDIMFQKAFAGISTAGKDEIRRWRADPTTSIDTTKDTPNAALMNQVADLVRRGVESYQVSTLILKRTRLMSVNLAPTIVLTEQTEFYSTARLITNEGIPAGLAGQLPITPYAPPTASQWGWLPRNANRSYISRGHIEEHSDWVFAAWSTVLYAYVA